MLKNDPPLRELLLPTFLLSDVSFVFLRPDAVLSAMLDYCWMTQLLSNAHQFRIGLADTRLCQCGRDIEDVHHYLLTCAKYESIRRDLLKSVDKVCSDDGHCSSLSLTTSLLLSPWLHDMTVTVNVPKSLQQRSSSSMSRLDVYKLYKLFFHYSSTN